MKIRRSVRSKGPATRAAGAAVGIAGLAFLGLGTAGIGTVTGGASSTNHCTAADALTKGVASNASKVISNVEGTCDVGGNSSAMPALGYIKFNVSAGGTTTLEDILQSDASDQDYFIGTYTLSFTDLVDQTHSANAVSTAGGTYTLAAGADEGEAGDMASTYPTEPSVTGTLPTITGTAGDVVTAAYQVNFVPSGNVEEVKNDKNDIFFNLGTTQETQAASNSVQLLGVSSVTTSTTSSSTPTTTSSSSGATTSSDTVTTSAGTTSNDTTATTSTGSSSADTSSATSTTNATTVTGSTTSVTDPVTTTATTTSDNTSTVTNPVSTTATTTAVTDPATTSGSTASTTQTTAAGSDPTSIATSTLSSADPSSDPGNSATPGHTTATPSTGADTEFGGGLALLTLGGFLLFGSSRRSRRNRP